MSKTLLVFLDKKEELNSLLWKYSFENPNIEKGFNVVIPSNEEEINKNITLRGVYKQEQKINRLIELKKTEPLEYFLTQGFEIDKYGNIGHSFVIEKTLHNWEVGGAFDKLLVNNSSEFVNNCHVKDICFEESWQRIYDNYIDNSSEKACIDAILDSGGWNDLALTPINIVYLVLFSCIETHIYRNVEVYIIDYN